MGIFLFSSFGEVAVGRGGFYYTKLHQETQSTTKVHFKDRVFSSFGGVAVGRGGFYCTKKHKGSLNDRISSFIERVTFYFHFELHPTNFENRCNP
ncbi:MAG: hypothetical protein ACOYBS_04725 [Flavobacterium sp.]